MPEILTESFCERCGTRYTFESVAPRKTRKLGQFKTLSKGVKNWVMDDDTSLDEAMAAARSAEEREATAQQLDAFHSTFNFCMNCRQYTCSNCWNGIEGRCLSCAPNLGGEILPAPFPDAAAFEPVRLDAEAWPEADLAAGAAGAGAVAASDGTETNGIGVGANGVHHDDLDGAWGSTNGAVGEDIPEIDPAARLAFLSGDAAPAWPVEATAADDALDGAADLIGLPGDEPALTPTDAATGPADASTLPEIAAAAMAAASSDAVTVDAGADHRAAGAAALAGAIAASHVPPPPLPADIPGRAEAAAGRTSDLLARFRPGQNIDAELAAFEAELEASELAAAGADVAPPAEAAPATTSVAEVAAAAAFVAAVEPGAEAAALATPEAETEDHRIAAAAALAAAAAAITPADADHADHEHDHAAAAAAASRAEPAAEAVSAEAAPAEPGPATPPVREDRIEQPTWRIYAPDAADPTAAPPSMVPGEPVAPGAAPIQASAEPQWPSRPDTEESPSMALLVSRARASSDAMWAASAQEVLAPASGGVTNAPVSGVAPCSNCGLSLSATARFCRRCGTRQG